MNKTTNIIISFVVALVFIGVSISFYFARYDSIAVFLIVFFAGVIAAASVIRGALALMGKSVTSAK